MMRTLTVFQCISLNQIVDKISFFFTSLWSDAKAQEKTEHDNETQLYKFRPRPFKLDNAYEVDLSSLSSSFSGDSFAEWKELLRDEENTLGVNPRTLFLSIYLMCNRH